MEIQKESTDVAPDIEFYINMRDAMLKYSKELAGKDLDDEKELKKVKLLFDIGDKAIQDRLKLLVQVGKIDLTLSDENDSDLFELLTKVENDDNEELSEEY
jgi:hypothetical protein